MAHQAIHGNTKDTKPHNPPNKFNRGPTQGAELWENEIFGCFQDFRICIFTFLCPCYTIGRNANHFGEDGVVIGVLYALGFGIALGPVLRWRIREEKNIVGSMIYDVLLHSFCPCCALIQENRELYGYEGAHFGERMPIVPEMDRK